MTTKPETAATKPSTEAKSAAAYVSGIHASRVRAEHHDRRVELLARDDVLANEIEARQTERHDISEALSLLSEPMTGVPVGANVVPLAAQ